MCSIKGNVKVDDLEFRSSSNEGQAFMQHGTFF